MKSYSFCLNGIHTLRFHVGDFRFFEQGDTVVTAGHVQTFPETGAYKLWIIRDENKIARLKFLRLNSPLMTL